MGRPPAGRSGTDDYEARVQAWVERTCADQGVPVKLSDPIAVEKVAETSRSGTPDRRQARRVETVVARSRGADDDRVDDGCDERVLLAEIERVPSARKPSPLPT